MTPYRFEVWDDLIRLDPERVQGFGSGGGWLDAIVGWWTLISRR
jgi:hypothetical protein